MYQDLKIKVKTIKRLGGNLCDIDRQRLLWTHQKKSLEGEKWKMWTFLKLKTSALRSPLLKKTKENHRLSENICNTFIFNKGLVCRIYKEL